jgi:hypothetical protein
MVVAMALTIKMTISYKAFLIYSICYQLALAEAPVQIITLDNDV